MKTEKIKQIRISAESNQHEEKLNSIPIAIKEVLKLMKELKLSESRIFDCLLAVTAKENGVEMIYTENVDDYKV